MPDASFLDPLRRASGDAIGRAWERLAHQATIGPRSRRARPFRRFGDGSAICFPVAALYGEEYIELGEGCIIGPYCSLSAGVMPGHVSRFGYIFDEVIKLRPLQLPLLVRNGHAAVSAGSSPQSAVGVRQLQLPAPITADD